MKRGTFAELLFFIAIVAIIYSPSTISLGSSLNPMTSSTSGLSHFVAYLQGADYHVEIANTSAQETSMLGGHPSLYVLIGADKQLTTQSQQTIYDQYKAGTLSILMAEGNTTNAPFIATYFGGQVTGAVITDYSSTFADQRQFYVPMNLNGQISSVFIDIASPLVTGPGLTPVARSSAESTSTGSATIGPRVIAAVSQGSAGARAFFITSVSPFTNALMMPATATGALGPNDTAVVATIVKWALPSGGAGVVLVDDSLYNSAPPTPSPGLPVGLLGIIILDGLVSSLATPAGVATSLFTGQTSLFGIPTFAISLAFALLALVFVRGMLRKYFASEKVIKDDQPIAPVERGVVAESRERLDFLSTSRAKSFYVATCAQLYEVVDEVLNVEFAEGILTLSSDKLASRLGQAEAARTAEFIGELTKLYEYATGKRRFLLPPVLSWKRKVASMSSQAEHLLNSLGMSMKGEGQSKQLEYAIKR